MIRRLEEPPHLLQILVGPRQVGKTTAIYQAIRALRRNGYEGISVTADALAAPPRKWISDNWRKAAALAKTGKHVLLAFDELQKIPAWSEVVKREFDAAQRQAPNRRPRVVISGSSALLVEKGLTESLAGRFELIRFPHWGLDEESKAFGVDLKRHIALGGYPRLGQFKSDAPRFLEYVRDSVIEAVLSRDLLLLHPVEKPALLRRLFEFACHHPAEIVSLQKMLGQLSERGNVTTIAHYLDLLSKAFLVAPIQKYSPEILRVRASSPKFVILAQALIAAMQGRTPEHLARDPERYGRWAENAVGAHLLRAGCEVYYWRDRDKEIDFIARKDGASIAIEVGTKKKRRIPGALDRLARGLGIGKTLVVGAGGIPLEQFLRGDPADYFHGGVA